MITAIHAAWIPRENGEYLLPGWLCLWVEKSAVNRTSKKSREHPSALRKEELEKFMAEEGGLGAARLIGARVIDGYFNLPTAENAPLKSQELLKYSGEEAPEEFSLQSWQIACLAVPPGEAPALLKELHFRFGYAPSETLLGADVLFWYHYTQAFKEIILKDQYIPALKYRELPPPKDKRRKQETAFEIHPAWEIVSPRYEEIVKEYAALMPPVCAAGSLQPAGEGSFWNQETLLRHFSENLLQEIVSGSRFTAKLEKSLAGSWIHACAFPWKKSASGNAIDSRRAPEEALKTYQKWASWKSKLAGSHAAGGAALCFQLQEARRHNDSWNLHFLAASQKDPSLRIALKDFWRLSPRRRAALKGNFGKEPEREILLNLGLAARIYPKIWQGLETERPAGMELNLDEAFGFLKETAWVLEDAGYKVAIPAWWTPQGRRRAKIRLKTKLLKGSKTPTAVGGKGLFGLDSIINYYYSLSIGGEEVSEAEWRALVSAKAPLVQFRGEWMELDRAKMQEMLAFWQAHGEEQPKMSLLDLLQISAKDDEYEIEHDAALAEMFDLLRDKRKFELLEEPPDFRGQLRDYQKRGVSWIAYLENLGLGGCLADDMGLGKTIQVIARLLQERGEAKKKPQPTLLLAPTSVLGNWQKEVERFAPGLAVMLHHGSGRIRDAKEFAKQSAGSDLVVSSYALARLDEALFTSREWERVVLDEAQNIKNPKAAQTRAILKINARHRLALTGTPVENRLLDLWSIFNFLNSGYLGNNAAFRRSFEIPIQKENDPRPARVLKSLVEPFILRRLKTDKEIIKDLPDKVEQKIYCNLTKEQASLYQAVVNDVMRQLEELEGIQRKGLILASLMKLKQICNHPAQFLQDGSAFSAERSHKLSRLGEMIEEAIESGESLLIFSQFQEICIALDRYLRQTLHYNTYVLHGQTPRRKRQEMIEEFQHPDTEPSIFILSLKAGGVGITLTKANHVFHFDRWWNPAVENQATDRAFRIGQSKNVFVHKYLTTGTLEERIDAMIEEKKKLAEAIVGADESWLTELDNEAFKKLIELNKSAILE